MNKISLPLNNETLQIADTTLAETLAWIEDQHHKPGFKRLLTLNPEILMAGHKNPDTARLIASADLTVPDGTGIVACLRFCYGKKTARVTGSDLAPALISSGKYRIYLLGGTPEVIEKAASFDCRRQSKEGKRLSQRVSPFESRTDPTTGANGIQKTQGEKYFSPTAACANGIQRAEPFESIQDYASAAKLLKHSPICGYHHGFWTESEWPLISAAIASANPDIVLVGMGFPQQDYILQKLKKTLPRGIGIGVGGVIDILAGVQKRAPKWTQQLHIEWLYRALKQPARLSRLHWIGGFAKYTLRVWWKIRHV
jgi:UDP-N-acetyl-D-mannosaminuronic acid transferase (WecB/TagA/CpsF family)